MQELGKYIDELNNEFKETIGGEFVRLDSGEIFKQVEVNKYIQRKIELYNAEVLRNSISKSKELLGITPDQRLINNRSKKPPKNKDNNKGWYDGGKEFNIVYRENSKELMIMDLSKNEKLVFFVLRDFVVYPYNYIMINDEIPRFTDLEPIVSLTERSIRDALKTLEVKGVLKLVQAGRRKAIYINPKYYATGKDLNMDTLAMFGLIEYDSEKVESYL